jgi:hypothetical protein
MEKNVTYKCFRKIYLIIKKKKIDAADYDVSDQSSGPVTTGSVAICGTTNSSCSQNV